MTARWFHHESSVWQAEACVFAAIFDGLSALERGNPGEALAAAYQIYRERSPRNARLSFERAFSLICDLQGIWLHNTPKLALTDCPKCQAKCIVSIGDRPSKYSGCVFCWLLLRYPNDLRIQAYYAARPDEILSPEREYLLRQMKG